MTKPVLHRKQEFIDALQDYQISPAHQQELDKIELALFISVTSAGRNTIMNELVKTGKYSRIISDTTRPIRQKDGVDVEHNGVEYWFRTEEEVLNDIKEGHYLEAELLFGQQVSGISFRELEKTAEKGMIAINDVDFGGAHVIKRAKPDTKLIMVLPPDPETWMERLFKRHDMPEAEIIDRLKTAKDILEDALDSDDYYLIMNHEIPKAVADTRDVIENGKPTQDIEEGRKVVADLLRFVNQRLEAAVAG